LEVFSPTQYYMQILSFLPGLDIVWSLMQRQRASLLRVRLVI